MMRTKNTVADLDTKTRAVKSAILGTYADYVYLDDSQLHSNRQRRLTTKLTYHYEVQRNSGRMVPPGAKLYLVRSLVAKSLPRCLRGQRFVKFCHYAQQL